MYKRRFSWNNNKTEYRLKRTYQLTLFKCDIYGNVISQSLLCCNTVGIPIRVLSLIPSICKAACGFDVFIPIRALWKGNRFNTKMLEDFSFAYSTSF